MGLIHICVEVSNPENPDVSKSVKGLVDMDAMLCILPSDILERLGVQRMGKRRVRSSNGMMTLDTGIVALRYRGDIAGTTVAFGAEGSSPIIGSVAITSLGYEFDAENNGINRVDAMRL